MFSMKRRVLTGLFVGLSFLAGFASIQSHVFHVAKSGPAIQHIAGDGGPIWPPSS